MSGDWAFDPFHGRGWIVERSYNKVLWMAEISDGVFATCAQERVDPILDSNQEAFNSSAGQRWGDGKIVASIPMSEYFDKFVPARQAGDDKYIKKLLNDSDYSKFRRFGGKI